MSRNRVYENYDSASLSTYLHWIMTEKLLFEDKEVREYEHLVYILADIDFEWSLPMDENRASDGLGLRDDFEYETGLYLDAGSGINPCCSVFEMMAALAYRCEHQLMRDPYIGDRTSKWFLEMCDNLGIMDNQKEDYIREKVNKFMHRDYGVTGKGSLFPIRKRGIDQKNSEIWKQLSAYINENYSKSDPELELFR